MSEKRAHSPDPETPDEAGALILKKARTDDEQQIVVGSVTKDVRNVYSDIYVVWCILFTSVNSCDVRALRGLQTCKHQLCSSLDMEQRFIH